LLTSKEYIYNMYIIYIPELEISSLFLFYQIFFFQILFSISTPLEESININSGINHLTHTLKDVSQILMALDFAHWGGSPSSYNRCSSRFHSLALFWYSKTIWPIPFHLSYHDNFHDETTIAHKDECKYNIRSQTFGWSGCPAPSIFAYIHTIWAYIILLNYN
jgi:hypothetical protein